MNDIPADPPTHRFRSLARAENCEAILATPVTAGIVHVDRVDAVWTAAAALGPANRSLLDLHLRYGLGPCELAPDLGTDCRGAAERLSGLVGRLEELAIATLGAQPELVDAAALFAASPAMPAPAHVKANAAAALARAGVPMHHARGRVPHSP